MAELIDLITSNFDYENFFSAKLTAPMTASDTDIFLDDIPTASEGVLVIDWDVAASREVIFYNSKTASKVTCPSVANGRGFDNSTATTHLSGANVIMAPVRAWFRLAQQLATTSEQGWKPLGYTPNTITANGNRSYNFVFNSVDLTSFISPGARLQLTRTVTAPTSCFSLDGTNDYYNDTSLSGMTFTDDYVAGAWVYLTSYKNAIIISRFNGTSGWRLWLDSNGQVNIQAFNAGAANQHLVTSYQSIPLNRWVHIAAQEDMTNTTNNATNNYIMIDGVDVPASVSRGGTSPTSLVQAGNLEIGSDNSGLNQFPGYIDQVFVTSAKMTQDNVRTIMSQAWTSSLVTTHSVVSAYSNGSTTDINTTNANNLTAQNGATTATDSPFSLGNELASGFTDGTTDFGIVTAASFSTNTTLTVQVPEGCTIPTSGGVSSVYYSTQDVPYGFPRDKGRWDLLALSTSTANLTTGTTLNNSSNLRLAIPVGAWTSSYSFKAYTERAGGTATNLHGCLGESNDENSLYRESFSYAESRAPSAPWKGGWTASGEASRKYTSQTTVYMLEGGLHTSGTYIVSNGSGNTGQHFIKSRFDYI